MRIRTIFSATATAILLSTTSLAAQSNPVVDTIVQDIVSMGYSRVEVKTSDTSITVEATGDAGKIERTYDANGTLLSEEIVAPSDAGVQQADDSEDDGTDDSDGDVAMATVAMATVAMATVAMATVAMATVAMATVATATVATATVATATVATATVATATAMATKTISAKAP